MNEFKIDVTNPILLKTHINSDAVVGSNVSLDDTVIRRSGLNTFEVVIKNQEDLGGKLLSIVSNFLATEGQIDPIINLTTVAYTLRCGEKEATFTGDTVKINENLFMAYGVIQLIRD